MVMYVLVVSAIVNVVLIVLVVYYGVQIRRNTKRIQDGWKRIERQTLRGQGGRLED